MIFDYESELYYDGSDEHDFDWYKAMLLSLPTDELVKEYRERRKALEGYRQEEPAMKRGKKYEYGGWVKLTHDERDLLNDHCHHTM